MVPNGEVALMTGVCHETAAAVPHGLVIIPTPGGAKRHRWTPVSLTDSQQLDEEGW